MRMNWNRWAALLAVCVVVGGGQAVEAGILAREVEHCRAKADLARMIMQRRQAGAEIVDMLAEIEGAPDDSRRQVRAMIEAAFDIEAMEGADAVAAAVLLFQQIVERRCVDDVVEFYDPMVRP